MAVPSPSIDLAVAAIRDADLPHPGGELLECFIRESVDPGKAADYLLQKLPVGLAAFLADWVELVSAFTSKDIKRVRDKSVVRNITTRDGAKCCISGLDGSLLDPLIVVRIFAETPKHLNPSLDEMLGVFLSPSLKDMALAAETGNDPQNLWLVRKSAAEAFREGYFRVRPRGDKGAYYVTVNRSGGPIQPCIVKEAPAHRNGLFTDHSSSGIAIPAHSALKILDHFSKPIRWTRIAQEIAQKTQKSDKPAKLAFSYLRLFSKPCATALTVLWSWVPAALRVATYRRLASLGEYLYGPSCSLYVQRLPFRLYMKTRPLSDYGGLENEHGALEVVRRYTHLTVPRPLDLVSSEKDSYLLSSAVPGYHIGLCIDIMSDEEVADFVRDLRAWLVQLRSIPQTTKPAYEIASAVGEGCFDYRISAGTEYDEDRGDFFGPFKDEDDFNNILRCGALPDVVHRGGHRTVFTHGDLNMRNIIVNNDGKLSGIVDWENSGWYPEYWDYTKAHFVTKHHRRWKKIVDKVFAELGDYQEELETEKKLWEYCF